MSIIEAIVLGLVQGLTEFIPISSSAHLRIVPALLGWPDRGALFTAVIQLGTLIAVIVYFAADIQRLIRAFFRGLATRRPLADEESAVAWYVIIGSIPVAVLGLTFKHFIETGARNLWLISTMLVVIALLLLLAERYAKSLTRRGMDELNMKDAIAVGMGQALALIPGSSRSGSTIMVALFRGLTHEAAARFSFLLSIPAITASGLLELFDYWDQLGGLGWMPVAIATIVSAVSGWASIYFLLRYLRTHSTNIFVYYRFALGALMFALLWAGVLKPMG